MLKYGKNKRVLKVEFFGGIVALILIICAVLAFLNYENAAVFFCIVVAMGSVLNAILAYLKLRKRNYLLGVVFGLITVALLVLLVIQIVIS